MTELHSFGGSALDRHVFDFETVADAPVADAGAADTGSASADAGNDGAAAPADVGAATDAAAAPVVAEPTPSIDWSSPDAQQALQQAINAREQSNLETQRQTEAQEARQTEFSDVEDALGLLGLTPDRIQAYFGRINEPFAQVAAKVQEQEQVAWVTGELGKLGTAHPDLLGEGVDKLSEFIDDDGKPLFDVAEVKQENQRAALYAAAAISQANPGIDHTVALAEGAKAVAARDAIVGKAAVEQFKRQLSGTGNAAVDIASGADGATRITGLEGGDELAFARRFSAEHNLR